MADNLNIKSKAMGQDEVMFLLDLISKYKVITTKATNSSNNRLKEEAWRDVANEFAALAGEYRRPQQLRLKWENLKKTARKREANIRQNHYKTGGGKPYIPPPDAALDRVVSILGATCNGYSVELGGDAEEPLNIINEAEVQLVDFRPLPDPQINNVLVVSGGGNGGGGESSNSQCMVPELKTPKRFYFSTPKKDSKKRKLAEDLHRSSIEKNLALAAYFKAKAEKVELENEKMKIELEKLKNNNYDLCLRT